MKLYLRNKVWLHGSDFKIDNIFQLYSSSNNFPLNVKNT